MVSETSPASEAKSRPDAGVKRVATGILVALVAVFLATFLPEDPTPLILFIRAMAEAGMIGGLADWFAVEALFRHPLGIPIPHTALLPKNQRRAAGNIARFIDEYFLVPEQLLKRIREVNPVEKLAIWAKTPEHAALISRELVDIARYVLRSNAEDELSPKTAQYISQTVTKSVDVELLTHEIVRALKGSVHGQILDNVLARVADAIDQNRDTVNKLVQDRSRWWVASSVDRKVVSVLVDGILSILSELGERESDLRGDFEDSVAQIIEGFETDGTLARHIDDGIRAFTSSGAFANTLSDLSRSLLHGASEEIERDPEEVIEMFAGGIQDACRKLLENPGLQDELNARLLEATDAVLSEIRPVVTDYITQTIAEWDPQMLVARMEAEVGRDLQFIRINGAVLGSLVGGLLFVITHFLLA